MDILIQQKSFSLGVQYDIETPTATWIAQKKILSLLPHITLKSANDSTLATITGHITFTSNFSIQLAESDAYSYHCEKLIKGVDMCDGPGGSYRLYSHKGFRYSIFQMEKQVAAFTQDPDAIGEGATFDLRVNSDANLILIVSMVLCCTTAENNERNNSTVGVVFGKIGPEDRSFDESWRPNDETANDS